METIPEIDSENDPEMELDNEPDMIPLTESESDLELETEQASQIESESLVEDLRHIIPAETSSKVDSECDAPETGESQPKISEPEASSEVDQQSPSLTQKLMNFMGFSGQVQTQTADAQINFTQSNPTDQIQTNILEVSEQITYRKVTEDESNLLESILELQSHR